MGWMVIEQFNPGMVVEFNHGGFAQRNTEVLEADA